MKQNKNLTIGIDIDGTVTDPSSILPFMNEAFGRNLSLADCFEYDLSNVYGIPSDELDQWFDEQGDVLYGSALLHNMADIILQQWYQTHRLVYISARDKKHLPITFDWFERFQIPYHDVDLIGSHDKISSARKWGVEVFLEDRLENALQLSEELHIPVLLFDTPYNQAKLPSLVKRIYSWEEGHHVLQELPILMK